VSTPLPSGVREPCTTSTLQPQRDEIQPAMSWAVALCGSPSTRAPATLTGSPRRPATESSVEVSENRQAVLRVQARSVSPGA
jgi:hypothetical protein